MNIQNIKKVLIANRGEIASRVQRACRELGLASATTVSEADLGSAFARRAEETVLLPGKTAQETYLDAELLVKKAKEHDCDAIHPGYGFLSENGDFAKLVTEAGLIFIGPKAETIYVMGDKEEAKKIAAKAQVPLAPSISLGEKIDHKKVAQAVGFPLLLKAAAGGGGRGMRIVRESASLASEIERARAEAEKYFADGRVFAERYIEDPRHVEVQVFGDAHGNVVHFGTRDCSAQRRHQKLIEEAPAPYLSDKTREILHQSAVALSKAVGYIGAGTVEFLVKEEEVFFLEMNTRIQVEHPVTEEAYGVDLVKLQLLVADGQSLTDQHRNATPSKHVIEYRIYAENPAENFVPDLGTITTLRRPEQRDWYREDGAAEEGSVITPYYDALLTKIIISGKTREEALSRSRYALRELEIQGVFTTIPFHLWLLYLSPFTSSPIEISYIEKEFSKKKLALLDDVLILDSEHRSYGSDEEIVEFLEIIDRTSNEKVPVRLLHRTDGLFYGERVTSTEKEAQLQVISQTKAHTLKMLAC